MTVFKATRIPFPGKPARTRIQLTDRDYCITTQVEPAVVQGWMKATEQTALLWAQVSEGKLDIRGRATVQDWYRIQA